MARSQSKSVDEKYVYDQIHHLKDMSRGELGAGGTTLSNKQFAQCRGLDETGNWSHFREDSTGAGSWTLNQSRTSNTVNEITDITETVGASWVTPVYSRAGNMTTMPQPASPACSPVVNCRSADTPSAALWAIAVRRAETGDCSGSGIGRLNV